MYKHFYQKCLLSIMIIGVTINHAFPLHSVAEEQKGAENDSLGPAGFQEAMVQTTSSIFAMDSYAKLILDQQETDLHKINSIHGDVRRDIIQHQRDAKMNATNWIHQMKPQIMKVDQKIIDFHTIFQAQYNSMLLAVDQKDRDTLKANLETLYTNILRNQKEVDALLEELKAFRERMVKDTTRFKNDVDQLTAILASTNAGIPALEQQIQTYNDSIKKSNDMVIAGGVLCVTLLTCLAGGPMIAVAKKDIANAEREIANVKAKISGVQAEIAILTDVKNKTINMTETIDAAITALQNISNQWYIVGAKYNNLLQNVKGISPEEFRFIKEDLNVAKDSWRDVKTYTEKLHESIKK
ncbi:HBL/NHE enterotoxin family protein [Bacillus cytotoxicus]|uniref:non-hemolytic enterotoxin subunit C n=1 Tax=Bacillus cytotoxicus TaxID=580165 RepID=UPI0035C9F160